MAGVHQALVLLSLMFVTCRGQAPIATCDDGFFDLYVLMDRSLPVGVSQAGEMIDLVRKFSEDFTLGPSNIQMGLWTFGETVRRNMKMNKHVNVSTLMQDMKENMLHVGGPRYLYKALEAIPQYMFVDADGDRPDAPNMVLLLTTGSSPLIATLQEHRKLFEELFLNITFVVVGIRENGDLSFNELYGIACNDSNVIVTTMAELVFKEQTIKDKFCAAIGTCPCCLEEAPAAPTTAAAPTPTFPVTRHECPENWLQDFLCDKTVVCNCTVVKPGYPTAGSGVWTNKDGIPITGRSLQISYDPQGPEQSYMCVGKNGLGVGTTGTSLKIETQCVSDVPP